MWENYKWKLNIQQKFNVNSWKSNVLKLILYMALRVANHLFLLLTQERTPTNNKILLSPKMNTFSQAWWNEKPCFHIIDISFLIQTKTWHIKFTLKENPSPGNIDYILHKYKFLQDSIYGSSFNRDLAITIEKL